MFQIGESKAVVDGSALSNMTKALHNVRTISTSANQKVSTQEQFYFINQFSISIALIQF